MLAGLTTATTQTAYYVALLKLTAAIVGFTVDFDEDDVDQLAQALTPAVEGEDDLTRSGRVELLRKSIAQRKSEIDNVWTKVAKKRKKKA